MEKLTANVTHSKWDKPKTLRWDVTHDNKDSPGDSTAFKYKHQISDQN